MFVCKYVCMYVFMYARMYIIMYVCMFVYMYVCMYVYICNGVSITEITTELKSNKTNHYCNLTCEPASFLTCLYIVFSSV